jgi:hypothetical protein
MKPIAIPSLKKLKVENEEPQYNLVVEFEREYYVHLLGRKGFFFGPYKTKKEAENNNKVIEATDIVWGIKSYIALPIGTDTGVIYRCLYPQNLRDALIEVPCKKPFYFEVKCEITGDDFTQQCRYPQSSDNERRSVIALANKQQRIIVGYYNRIHPEISLDRSHIKPVEMEQPDWTLTLTTAFIV